MRNVLKNTGWLLGGRGVNAIFSLGYLALATRILGVEDFGRFVLIVGLGQAMVGIAGFHTWQLVVRWGGREETADDAVGFALALDAVSVVVGIALSAILLYPLEGWLPLDRDHQLPALLFCVASMLAIRSTPTGLLRLHDRYAWAVAAESVLPLIRFIGAALVAWFMPSETGFLIAWGVAELVCALAHWISAARCHPIPWSRFSLFRLPAKVGGAWQFAWGTKLSGSLSVVSRQVFLLLIGTFGGAALAGIYRVAAQLGQALLKLAQSLLFAIYPELERDPDAAHATARRVGRIAALTALAAVIIAAAAGKWLIVAVAGAGFAAAYMPMVILSAAGGVELAGASLEALLVARGRALAAFLIRGMPTFASLAALPWLIDWIGAAGAASAVLGASGVTLAGYLYATRLPRTA